MAEYEAVIGLETHIQVKTRSKIFCGCKADSWNEPPNVNICPVCSGLPGVLPVLNHEVVGKAVRLASALQAQSIQSESYFARKNYFYPDLPKGYQISQYDEPLARAGQLELPLAGGERRLVAISKLHLEEDAGRTIYQAGRRLIDFNRCGVPLVEMVTGPDLRSAEEVAQFLIRLRQLLRWLDISDADMERGQLRCDANVSIREPGSRELNPKTEIKNVNSIANIRQAVQAEIERQIREVEAGRTIESWTLDWDDERGVLSKLRSKETEADYRYFRDPDLLPIRIEEAEKQAVRQALPELPLARRGRLVQAYGLPEYDAEILTEERTLSDFFESSVSAYGGDPKRVSNWVMNEVLRLIRQTGTIAGELSLKPTHLAEIIQLVDSGMITAGVGKRLLEEARGTERTPRQIVEEQGLIQVTDLRVLREAADRILQANPDQVGSYRAGKVTILGWFVGQLMREMGGRADAKKARELLQELLEG